MRKYFSTTIYFHLQYLYLELNKCGHRNVLSKRQVWMSIFLLTLKKKKIMDKKTNPGLLFLLKVQSCVFISNVYHSPPPPPKGYTIVSLIIDSDSLFKINLGYKTTDICSIFNADLSFSCNKFLFFSLNCQNITFI